MTLLLEVCKQSNHHGPRNPPDKRRRPSAQHRDKLSEAQKAYVASDPRWQQHRDKLAAAQVARRMTLMDEELVIILALRKKGRTFAYIAEEIGVCRDVITRELRELGFSTAHLKKEKRARRGRGFWRCFD